MERLALRGAVATPTHRRQQVPATALGRLSNALAGQNAVGRTVCDGLAAVIADLLHPAAGEKAASAEARLSQDLLPGLAEARRMLRQAVAIDDGFARALAPCLDATLARLRRLDEMGVALRAALSALSTPADQAKPFGLIRMGLEFIEQAKRHQRWIDQNVRPVVERCHRRAVARMAEGCPPATALARGAPSDPPVARVYTLDGVPVGRTPGRVMADPPDERTGELLEALAARYGARGLSHSSASVADDREDEVVAVPHS